MKRNSNFSADKHDVLDKDIIPNIPLIAPIKFARSLGNGTPMARYISHLLCCKQEDYSRISLICLSHGYDVSHIETFKTPNSNLEYVFFKIIIN